MRSLLRARFPHGMQPRSPTYDSVHHQFIARVSGASVGCDAGAYFDAHDGRTNTYTKDRRSGRSIHGEGRCVRIRDVVNRTHLLVGLAGLAAFLLTGQYMDRWLSHLDGMPDGPRALYRSGHIYILFSALLNLVLGVYVVTSAGRTSRWLQYVGSALLVGGLGLFVYGFFAETPLALVERPVTREAIVWSLGGVLFHGTSMLVQHRRRHSAPD